MPFVNVPDDTIKIVVTRADGSEETYRAQTTVEFVKDTNGTWSMAKDMHDDSHDDVGNYRG